MVVTCVIEFDNNPYGTYYAGQFVSGNVTLQVDKPKQVKGVVLKISGSADTSWVEHSSTRRTDANGNSRRHTKRTQYGGHEDYIKSKTYLLGSDQNQSSVIEPGIYTYRFAFHLSHTCPSSFEGYYGHIRYLVRVELIRPWKFDQTFTRCFTVLKVKDLNYDSPLLRAPCNSDAQKVFCCGPCKTLPLDMHVSLPQSGYVPGQTMHVSVLIANETNLKIKELNVELIMLICYYSQTPRTATRNERIVVTKVKGDGVPIHCKKQFYYPLIVPATPPTCFTLCRILQIAYQVEVEVKVKGWHADQVVCLPVTVGTVPLLSVIQTQPIANDSTASSGCGMQRSVENGEAAVVVTDLSTEMASADGIVKQTAEANAVKTNAFNITITAQENITIGASSDVTTSAPPSPWSADASIPPPTYEAAIHMKPAKINAGEAHSYGEAEFAPRYPVFNIPSSRTPGADEADVVGATGSLTSNSGTSAPKATSQNSTWL